MQVSPVARVYRHRPSDSAQPVGGVVQGALDIRFADGDFVHSAATQATDIEIRRWVFGHVNSSWDMARSDSNGVPPAVTYSTTRDAHAA